ncbi:MAG: sugar ABC transporter permease [Clostridia bacterium]|nr:sugar ABC transporter permease [Clostridia bacterium]
MHARKKETILLLMALPAFIGFMTFFITPAVMSFGYSVTNWSVYRPEPSYVGLKNFQTLFSDAQALAAIEHSIRYALIMTVVQNTLAIFLAVLLNKKLMMANVLKTIFFLPAVLSILVVGYLFKFIMTSAPSGMLNSAIGAFGGAPVNWLGDPNLALYSVLATQVWQWTGWAMVIYIANLKSIDASLYEAARIDGAGPMQVFGRVTLPLLYPATSFNVLMSLIGGLKMFDAVYAMTRGGPGYASETIMTTMISTGFKAGRNAYACAFAVVFFVVVFTMSKAVTFVLNKWEAAIT